MRLLLLLLLTATAGFSQAQEINGWVKDENGAPFAGVSVNLMRTNDSTVAKLDVTKTGGTYGFSGIKEGKYKVLASHIGFKPAFSPLFTLGSTDVLVTELKLARVSGHLGNVTVTAQKPMVEVKADKTILKVEGTINAMGTIAMELIRKSPGVLLDKDDNISLAGKNGVQVYVDGRSTPLSGTDLANYLKSLPSSQIEEIELITNPSAKYDAAGNAGIINIKLIRNKALGTNGSVNAGWNMALSSKYNAGASLNYRNKTKGS
jgi:iron complex outermembrane recepter protein